MRQIYWFGKMCMGTMLNTFNWSLLNLTKQTNFFSKLILVDIEYVEGFQYIIISDETVTSASFSVNKLTLCYKLTNSKYNLCVV